MSAVSVLMSSFNSADFIHDSIDSILNQTYSDFELIIVDDASTDSTLNIINGYNDPRIKLYPLKKNVGVGAALSFGLDKVQGKYVAKADSDDINMPERFEKQLAFLTANPEVALCKTLIEYFPHNKEVEASPRYGSMKKIKEKQLNRIVTPEQIRKALYWWCCVPHNSILVRKETICAVGYRKFRLGEDYYLFYDLNKIGYKMSTVEEVLVSFRVRSNSITGSGKYIEAYITTLFNMKKDELDRYLNNKGYLYIWGTGNLGKNIYQLLKKKNHEVAGFIDTNEKLWGESIMGLTVMSPAQWLSLSEEKKVIVAAQPVREKVVSFLEENGFVDQKNFFVFA